MGKGANMKTAFIIKNENGEINVMDEILKALANFKFKHEDEINKSIDAIALEKNLGEAQKETLKTALAVLESMGEGIVKDLYFNVSDDFASVSIFKSKEEFENVESETLKTLKSELAEVAKSYEKLVKEAEGKIDKSELDTHIEKSGEKIAKLSDLIEDKEAVDKIVKENVQVMKVPEAVQKQLDDQAAIIKTLQEEKALDEDIKLTKAFEEKATSEFKNLGSAKSVGAILKTCSAKLEKSEFESLSKVLKSSSNQLEEAGIFKEFGKEHIEKNEDDSETSVDARAAKIKKANPEVSIEKARIKAREEIKELNNN